MDYTSERQKELYVYLESVGDKWSTQEEVSFYLADRYPYIIGCDFHNCNTRMVMTRDIREINENPNFEKIIISSSKGVKLANEEEFAKYISKQYASVFRRLQRVRIKERKGKAHYNITFDENAEIDTVESLLSKYENEN